MCERLWKYVLVFLSVSLCVRLCGVSQSVCHNQSEAQHRSIAMIKFRIDLPDRPYSASAIL